ncbi:MAG: hypothetical protein KIT31_21645, partial [Deltaproteobacteria bacterium]|nr:hypothetical protein [Deltaproteobacteria bacterium]
MNAVAYLVARLSGDAARRLARKLRRRDADVDEARAAVAGRWEDDLCGFLNALSREELGALAEELRVAAPGRSPELRAALWDTGA